MDAECSLIVNEMCKQSNSHIVECIVDGELGLLPGQVIVPKEAPGGGEVTPIGEAGDLPTSSHQGAGEVDTIVSGVNLIAPVGNPPLALTAANIAAALTPTAGSADNVCCGHCSSASSRRSGSSRGKPGSKGKGSKKCTCPKPSVESTSVADDLPTPTVLVQPRTITVEESRSIGDKKRYTHLLVLSVKNRFGLPVDNKANRLAIRKTLLDEMTAHGIRPAHIAQVIDVCVELVFIPNDDQLRAEQVAACFAADRGRHQGLAWSRWFRRILYGYHGIRVTNEVM